MNRILTFATVIAVGSASFAAFAQSPANAPGEAPYGKFRPLEGQQAAAPEQPAATPVKTPVPEQPTATPVKAPEAPLAQAAPAAEQRPATSPKAMSTRGPRPIARAPNRYGRGVDNVPGFGRAYPGDPRARYLARKRMMYDRNQNRRHPTPHLGYGRYPRLGPSYGMPAPYPGAQPGPGTTAPGVGHSPEAGTGRPGS